MNSTGIIVRNETTGNITRPPNLSVRAPTGTRPTDPTTTGTATNNAWENADRCRPSLKRGPRGLSSAHAQKFTAKPRVARASISIARRDTIVAGPAVPRSDGLIVVVISSSFASRDISSAIICGIQTIIWQSDRFSYGP